MTQAKTLGRLSAFDWSYIAQPQISGVERVFDFNLTKDNVSTNNFYEALKMLPTILYSSAIIYNIVIASMSMVSASII